MLRVSTLHAGHWWTYDIIPVSKSFYVELLETYSCVITFIATSGCPHIHAHTILLYPRSTEDGMGIYWIQPMSVRPSVHPSVCRQGFRNFSKKNIGSIHFIPGIYPYGVGLLTPSHFRVPSLIFCPSGDQIFGRKWGFRKILKKLLAQFISYLTFTFMGWVSWPLYVFVFLASFSALWWPNIWPKSGFPELFEKKYWLNSFHFLPGIYPYGVGLLTPIHFRVPSLIFGPLVAKYLAENGVSGIKKK